MMRLPRPFSPAAPSPVDPHQFITPAPPQVTVNQTHGRTLHLRWPVTAVTTRIYRTATPDHFPAGQLPVAEVHHAQDVTIPDDGTAVRPYFRLDFSGGPWHGRQVIAAERFLPLQGGVNGRDMGGYETANGRVLHWGTLYRSGLLALLTDADLHYLSRLDLRLICDLRTVSERQKRPNRLPDDPQLRYLHLPADNLERAARLRGLAAILFDRSKLDGLMDEGYTRVMIEENADLIGAVFRLLADPASYPMLIHCSAGKDRTAVIIGLLLQLLGVPEATILADYTLSNTAYQKVHDGIQEDLAGLRHLGITAHHLQALILVKAERLQKMLHYVQNQYGGVQSYLQQKAGVEASLLQRLPEILLTSPHGAG